VKTEVAEGRAVEVVPAVARRGYDLVLLNTRVICDTYGRAGVMKWILGSVAAAVLRNTSIPLLMVGNYGSVARYARPSFSFERILVPLDGSRLAEQALPLALAFAKAAGCSLFLFMIRSSAAESNSVAAGDETTTSRYLEAVADRYKDTGVRINFAAREGEPVLNICATASALDCDLIVMATQGKVGEEGLSADVESVTEQVAIKSSVPVLVLRGKLEEAKAGLSQRLS
jgi:nucleotide-binding universal stress UspA family protein